MVVTEHTDLHECDHDCHCFWCRVSRREKFETGYDTQEIEGPKK
jgi:hypothetical protein